MKINIDKYEVRRVEEKDEEKEKNEEEKVGGF